MVNVIIMNNNGATIDYENSSPKGTNGDGDWIMVIVAIIFVFILYRMKK